MRHAQIERLRALRKMITQEWYRVPTLADVKELVDILLMEVEDHDAAGSEQ